MSFLLSISKLVGESLASWAGRKGEGWEQRSLLPCCDAERPPSPGTQRCLSSGAKDLLDISFLLETSRPPHVTWWVCRLVRSLHGTVDPRIFLPRCFLLPCGLGEKAPLVIDSLAVSGFRVLCCFLSLGTHGPLLPLSHSPALTPINTHPHLLVSQYCGFFEALFWALEEMFLSEGKSR